MLGKPYYEVDVRDLQRASTVDDGKAWRAMTLEQQMSYAKETKPPRQEWRKWARDNKVQRSYATEYKASLQAKAMKKKFPNLDFVVRELTPVNMGF